jgi:diadenosine tetraphosphate (Ap4A) HIT family hydrolase
MKPTTKDYHSLERSNTPECEFCNEFSGSGCSRFTRTYDGTIDSRIIDQQAGVVVLPTIGQLFLGSLLIMPSAHFETIAEMPSEQIHAALRLIDIFSERLSIFGKTVVFEHGARAGTGRSCGIYHAHIHLVPLPANIAIENVLPDDAIVVATLEDAYTALKNEETYLLFRDTYGKVGYVAGRDAHLKRYSSQYFRKVFTANTQDFEKMLE